MQPRLLYQEAAGTPITLKLEAKQNFLPDLPNEGLSKFSGKPKAEIRVDRSEV
jgi:hypothetical protein